jgi:hypothetical protein
VIPYDLHDFQFQLGKGGAFAPHTKFLVLTQKEVNRKLFG